MSRVRAQLIPVGAVQALVNVQLLNKIPPFHQLLKIQFTNALIVSILPGALRAAVLCRLCFCDSAAVLCRHCLATAQHHTVHQLHSSESLRECEPEGALMGVTWLQAWC